MSESLRLVGDLGDVVSRVLVGIRSGEGFVALQV